MEENIKDTSEEPVVPVRYSTEMRRMDFDTVAQAMNVFSYIGASYNDEITAGFISLVQDRMLSNLERVLDDLKKAEVEYNTELITNYAVRDSIFSDTNHIVDAFEEGDLEQEEIEDYTEMLKQGYGAAKNLIDNITSKAKDITIVHEAMDYTQELIEYYSDSENVRSSIITFQMQGRNDLDEEE